jgi:hypothetical protein
MLTECWIRWSRAAAENKTKSLPSWSSSEQGRGKRKEV